MLTRHVGRGSTEPLSTFSSIDGGRSRICSFGTSRGGHCLPLQQPKKFRKDTRGKRYVGLTYGFAASPEVGPGATVSILQTRYPHVQALSQDKGKDVHSHVSMTLGYATRHGQLGCCQLLLSGLGQLRCHHMSRGPSS
jgi:hypothetical protein